MERAKVLGILGGIGSGKSTVGRMFADLGAVVLDADRSAHACLEEAGVRTAIRRQFPDVFQADGSIDRARLAGKVFDDPTALAALEAIVHPRVREDLERRLGDAQRDANTRLVVLDVPLLLETPWNDRCDERVFLDVPQAERERRVAATRDWSAADLARRESRQRPLDEKRRAARFVIDNSLPLDAVRRQVEAVFSALTHSAGPTGEPPSESSGSIP